MNWESLIGERMRPCATICAIEDPVQRNRVENDNRRSKLWRDNHPDYYAEYYASHKEKIRANADKWKKDHPEAMREYARRYRARHKEKVLANADKWKKDHPEAMREYARKYRARHKDDPAYKAKKKIYNDTYRGKLKKAA